MTERASLDPRDEGTVTAFVVCLVVAFVLCAALAVDGGRLVASRVAAADHAENAARVGAQEVSGLRSGARMLDPARARRAVDRYLGSHGLAGDVVVSATTVTVTVVMVFHPTLLRLAGVGERRVTATRSAEPYSDAAGVP